MKNLALVLGVMLIAFSSAIHAKEFYVSPQGNDSSPGTKDLPFKTIAHAKSKVRAWKQANGNENITVGLSGGQYRLSETLVFGLEDAADDGHRITYSAMPGETPVINSDVSITGWKKLDQSPQGLPPSARGKVWVAPVPEAARDLKTVYDSAGMLPRAKTQVFKHLRESGGRSGPRRARDCTGLMEGGRMYGRPLTQDEVRQTMEISAAGSNPLASGPSPADGSRYEASWVNLRWNAGVYAVSHDVYIGEDLDQINNATVDSPVFRGNQADAMLITGFVGFPYPDGLVPGTTYYWRIDEVNDTEPNSPWKGDVWSFSIPPKTAYNPDPADGAEFVDVNAVFTWTPGFEAKVHTVYMGTNFDDVNDDAGGPLLAHATYSPDMLEPERVYYWRVDEFDGFETHKGDIWSFTTPGAVGNPQPANGAVDVQMNATLSWTAADNATSHELYFGADADAVGSATTASPEYVGPRALGAESYDPGQLAWDSSYAWRADEVYPTETVKGLVWSFTTAALDRKSVV